MVLIKRYKWIGRKVVMCILLKIEFERRRDGTLVKQLPGSLRLQSLPSTAPHAECLLSTAAVYGLWYNDNMCISGAPQPSECELCSQMLSSLARAMMERERKREIWTELSRTKGLNWQNKENGCSGVQDTCWSRVCLNLLKSNTLLKTFNHFSSFILGLIVSPVKIIFVIDPHLSSMFLSSKMTCEW